MSPGELRQQSGNSESWRQPGCPRFLSNLESSAWHWDLCLLPGVGRRRVWYCLLVLGCILVVATNRSLAEPATAAAATNSTAASNNPVAAATNATPRFDVQAYVVNCNPLVFSNAPTPLLSGFTGTNVTLDQILKAASETLFEFQKQGYLKANISIAQDRITNGVVTMNVFQGTFPQVLISGQTRFRPSEAEIAAALAAVAPVIPTNAAPARTNAAPHFSVQAYEITGDTLLSTNTLLSIFAKGVGTNITLTNIMQAATDLQQEYRDRGFPTVNVTIPPQQITNGIVKIRVFEGRLAEIRVTKNRYYSSNNVMSALPDLHTNMILLRPVFQAELDRANANQDRQIYPQIEPGPLPNTSVLVLGVKDRLPLHGKIELNNDNSPGTPELRINGSAVYNNLWQLNHSLGVQYSGSPELYKQGPQWPFYDQPLVANYSGFYRMPLGSPESLAADIESRPGTFGFNEATRKFDLPPPSGAPELNLYASRSTIDTGLETSPQQTIYDVPGVRQVFSQNVQQDLTVNEDIGFRLSGPLPETGGLHSTFSSGLDIKTYNILTTKTNNFQFTEITVNADGSTNPPIVSTVSSPVPTTVHFLQYLPVTLRYDGNWRDPLGPGSFGLGVTGNVWHSGSSADVQAVTGSSQSTGYWVTLNPSFSHDFTFHHNWVMTLRADGQWASEPLLSIEQFSTGGTMSVRGYHEGEVFGDTGWHVSLEQKTPGHIVGNVGGKYPLILRGSVYVDYAESFLLDPQGRPSRTPLCGTGFGFVASVGSIWEARFLFSLPLLPGPTIEEYQPYFNFSLTAQF